MIILGLVAGVVAVLILYSISIYNGLVTRRNEVRNGWNQIDVQLKRRHDLIPNLIETVKGYAQHEKGVLENVTKLRNLAQGAKNRSDQIHAEAQLSGALANLFAISENYPDLKANQNFLALQEELASTENKIGFSRQAYNDSVMGYNNERQVFPNVIFASFYNFSEEPYWKITDVAEREAPKVKFST